MSSPSSGASGDDVYDDTESDEDFDRVTPSMPKLAPVSNAGIVTETGPPLRTRSDSVLAKSEIRRFNSGDDGPTPDFVSVADDAVPEEGVTPFGAMGRRRMSCPYPSPGDSFSAGDDVPDRSTGESPSPTSVSGLLSGVRFPFANVFSARAPAFGVPEDETDFSATDFMQRIFGRVPDGGEDSVAARPVPVPVDRQEQVSSDPDEQALYRSLSDSPRSVASSSSAPCVRQPLQLDVWAQNADKSGLVKAPRSLTAGYERAVRSCDSSPVRLEPNFVKQVRHIMRAKTCTVERIITVQMAGVLWKTSRPKSMKNALGKILEASHWASNVKKGVDTVKHAMGHKTDDEPAKMRLRIVELCMIQENGVEVPYLRWARIPEQEGSPVSVAPEPIPSLSSCAEADIKEKPLLGSLVVDNGVSSSGSHFMEIYFPWGTRNSALPYKFAADDANQFHEWLEALRRAGKRRSPTAEEYKEGIKSAQLRLKILDARHHKPRGLGDPLDTAVRSSQGSGDVTETESAFCVVHFQDAYVARTPCSPIDMGECARWDHQIDIVIDRDEPDECVVVEMYLAPSYADAEPNLLGKISIPLWFFDRRQDTDLSLDLKNPDQLRKGVTPKNPVTIQLCGYYDQPLRSVFLPLELPANLTEVKADFDLADFMDLIARIEALIGIYDNLIVMLKYVLLWESFSYSCMWLVGITVWFWWIPEYTLSILLALVTFYTIKYHWTSRARQFGGKVFGSHYGSASWLAMQRDGRSSGGSASMDGSPKVDYGEEEDKKEPSRRIYENERRWPFSQFDPQYLLIDIDFPHYMDAKTHIVMSAPKALVVERDGVYNYRWEVEITPETDENGWQYATSGTSTQWRNLYSSLDCFFRRRLHLGYRLHKHTAEPDDDKDDEDSSGQRRLVKRGTSSPNSFKPAPHSETATSEADIFKQHKGTYCKIRNDVEIFMRLIEKYKNLFSGRLKWLTEAIKVVLVVTTVLSFVVPTRYVLWYFVVDYFRWGWSCGTLKRANIDSFLNKLQVEKNGNKRLSVCKVSKTDKWDPTMNLEEFEFAPLGLRNWLNRTFKIKLSLKQIASCKTLYDLAALVVNMSDEFVKDHPRKRNNPWLKSFDNLLDHVPSDLCRFQVDNAAYG